MRAALLGLLLLAGCATAPKLVMVNPRSGVAVDCEVPDARSSSGAFLASRACLSACQAHGFRPVPGVQATGSDEGVPTACLN